MTPAVTLMDVVSAGIVWLIASVFLALLLGQFLSWDRRFYDAWDEPFDWAEDEERVA